MWSSSVGVCRYGLMQMDTNSSDRVWNCPALHRANRCEQLSILGPFGCHFCILNVSRHPLGNNNTEQE